MAEAVQQPSLALVRHADAIQSSDNTCRPQAKAARLMLAEILRKENIVARDARTVSKMRFQHYMEVCALFFSRVFALGADGGFVRPSSSRAVGAPGGFRRE